MASRDRRGRRRGVIDRGHHDTLNAGIQHPLNPNRVVRRHAGIGHAVRAQRLHDPCGIDDRARSVLEIDHGEIIAGGADDLRHQRIEQVEPATDGRRAGAHAFLQAYGHRPLPLT